MKCFFVNPEYLFKYYAAYLDNNIDPNMLNTFILSAEWEKTQASLGYTLYEKYLTVVPQVQAANIQYGTTASQAIMGVQYDYLFTNYIQDEVALWCIYAALPLINFRVTNKSISQKQSQWSKSSAINEIEYLRNEIRNKAMYQDMRIREYITNFPSSFPEYFQVTGVNRITPSVYPYNGGIYLEERIFSRNKAYRTGCPGCFDGIGIPLWGT
jgi:hypothetical protein